MFGDADNVDWTDATMLGGTLYPNGLIFVNEDTGTGNGEIWMMLPDGSGLTKIGDTTGISGSTESSGILDISQLVGYEPGSVLLTSNQGSNASLSVLINPEATLVPEPSGHCVGFTWYCRPGTGRVAETAESITLVGETDPPISVGPFFVSANLHSEHFAL